MPPPEPDGAALTWVRELTERSLADAPDACPEQPLFRGVKPYPEPEAWLFGSTDVGDVSWVCPTAQIHAAVWARGTPGHSWQVTAQGKSDYAHAMMRYASKVLAAEAIELLTNPQLLEEAQREHRRKVGPDGYEAPIPEGVRPVAIGSLGRRHSTR